MAVRGAELMGCPPLRAPRAFIGAAPRAERCVLYTHRASSLRGAKTRATEY